MPKSRAEGRRSESREEGGLSDRERWAENAPKVAMALNEAGYPCHFEEYTLGWEHVRENVIVFDAPRPPLDVIVRAGELCGIADLVARAFRG